MTRTRIVAVVLVILTELTLVVLVDGIWVAHKLGLLNIKLYEDIWLNH